jgi:hypothetical protein
MDELDERVIGCLGWSSHRLSDRQVADALGRPLDAVRSALVRLMELGLVGKGHSYLDNDPVGEEEYGLTDKGRREFERLAELESD